MTNVRKKKPKAPSMSLHEAIEKTQIIYKAEGRHTVPTESVAGALGYANARSGSAITAIASIKMFGLLNSPQPGHLAIDQSFEEFKYSPDKNQKREILINWLTTPKIFAELLQRFEGKMPSDATLKYELVKIGFSGKSLNNFIESYKESVIFSQYYEQQDLEISEEHKAVSEPMQQRSRQPPSTEYQTTTATFVTIDRIPIRLPGGRRAWLELPEHFYESDKKVLQRQIDVIVADSDDINQLDEEVET